MGCDHLNVRVFKKSMEELRDNHRDMYRIYRDELIDEFKWMKKAWDTPKGWKKINDLALKVNGTMIGTNGWLEEEYIMMNKSGTDWARSQDVMMFFIPPMLHINYEAYNTGEHDGELNEVNKEEVLTHANNIKIALNEIKDCMNKIEIVTKDDDTFGYYSTGTINPREEINSAVKKGIASLDEEFTNYMSNMNKDIEEDNAEREKALSQAFDNIAK